jgi:multidrug resistance efflux pump
MKRVIKHPSIPYRAVEDRRREGLRFGKYVYLAVIAALLIFLVDRAFGYLYLLRGDGFVYARNQAVALEYDATIRALEVENGDVVRAGDPLLRYDSVWVRNRIVELATRIGEFQNDLSNARVRAARLDAAIDSTEDEVGFSRRIQSESLALSDRGLIDNERLSELVHRFHQAERTLLELEAAREQLVEEIPIIEDNLARVRDHYGDLLDAFGDGAVDAPQSGVVANLRANVGAVVTSGTAILDIFGAERYLLAYMDDRSPIDYAPGDPVVLRFAGGAFAIGRIADLTAVADRLPEEFQPRFTTADRDRLVRIEVDDPHLENASMLSTVRIYKPLGLETVLAIYDDWAG